MIIEDADFCVRIVALPYGIHGCVTEDADGFYSVYLNSRDSFHRRRLAWNHEIKKHIMGNDFAKHDVRDVEDL